MDCLLHARHKKNLEAGWWTAWGPGSSGRHRWGNIKNSFQEGTARIPAPISACRQKRGCVWQNPWLTSGSNLTISARLRLVTFLRCQPWKALLCSKELLCFGGLGMSWKVPFFPFLVWRPAGQNPATNSCAFSQSAEQQASPSGHPTDVSE